MNKIVKFFIERPIWTNAIMVAAGFFVLTLGEARTLYNVGLLISVAMVAAGAVTFLAVPVLARRPNYNPLETKT